MIVPTFNRYKFLQNAIESVLSQNVKDLEIIILNDGSTEKEYYSSEFRKNNKIKWVDLDIERKLHFESGPQNIASLRNLGLDIAKGEFIAFLDDDDLWMPQKLESQISSMKEQKIYFSCTEGYFGNGIYDRSKKYKLYNKEHYFKNLNKIYSKTPYKLKDQLPEVWNKEFLEIHNCVVTSSVVVKSSLINEIGGFNLINWAEDYDCWLRVLDLSNILYIDEPLFFYDGNHGDGRLY